MNEPLEQLIARLRAEYLAEIPDRLAEMDSALEHWAAGEPPEGPALLTLFHRLAGSAGAYGFGDVSGICRGIERWLAGNPSPDPEGRERVSAALASIRTAFARPPTTEGIEA